MLYPMYDTFTKKITWATDDVESMYWEAKRLTFLKTYRNLVYDIENGKTIDYVLITEEKEEPQ